VVSVLNTKWAKPKEIEMNEVIEKLQVVFFVLFVTLFVILWFYVADSLIEALGIGILIILSAIAVRAQYYGRPKPSTYIKKYSILKFVSHNKVGVWNITVLEDIEGKTFGIYDVNVSQLFKRGDSVYYDPNQKIIVAADKIMLKLSD
jgi:hypothetical protein